MSPPRPALAELARQLGITDGYESALERCWKSTSDETREALAAAMGFAASTEQDANRSLSALEASESGRWLPELRVARAPELSERGIELRTDRGLPAGDLQWTLRCRTADGRELDAQGRAEAHGASVALPAPDELPIGEHTLEVEVSGEGRVLRAEQQLIVVPELAQLPDPALGAAGGFGLMTQLYTLRRQEGWGAGDLGELRELLRVGAAEGAAFVALNPLHALANRERRVCPYSPLSRLYRNPVYLEIEAIPEWQHDSEARRLSAAAAPTRAALLASGSIDLPGVAAAKRPVLERLYEVFVRRESAGASPRGAELARYRELEGDALVGFATFMAIAEHLEREGSAGCDPFSWRTWPRDLRDPLGPAVTAFAYEHPHRIGFHTWCQFELDRQLGEAATGALRRGLPLGLFTDLALGSAAGGSDEWLAKDLHAEASTGAPPDDFAPSGQDWSFPPIDPRALREDRYRLWIRLLRSAFSHAGGLRLDHALSLRRLFWIPPGRHPSEGAYVTYPESDLLGLLALESRRSGAIVIAEDLGTVPEGFSQRLRDRGLLSSSVLLFSREDGGLRPPEHYAARALATASTHDLPPIAAWRGETDLLLRRSVGQITDENALESERRDRTHWRSVLAESLKKKFPTQSGDDPLSSAERLAASVTAFLCGSRSQLVGLSVDDLAGEIEPLNLPGVPAERHPSWRRAVGVAPEALPQHPVARASFDAIPSERRSVAGGDPQD